MKYNYLSSYLAIFVILLVNFPIGLSAQNIANQSTLNRTIYFGLTDNAPPVSDYRDHRGWEGYCDDFLNSLEKRIKEGEGKVNVTEFKIERQTVTVKERFSGFGENGERFDAECGPHTNNEERQKIIKENNNDGQFSDTFARTGAKILLKKANVKYFYSLKPFKDKNIGAIKKTTTNSFIDNRYKEAMIVAVQRPKVVEQLENGNIDAFVSDEIILKGILNEMNLFQRRNYVILPKFTSLSYEQYGMVVYRSNGKNKKLLDYINKLIEKKAEKDRNNEYQFPGNSSNNVLDIIYGIYYKFDSAIISILIPFNILLFLILLINLNQRFHFFKALRLAVIAGIEHKLDQPIITFFQVFIKELKKK